MQMIDVKLTFPSWPIIRQTPGQKGIWGNCRFFCNTSVKSCDYWFVVEGLNAKKETVFCPKNRTVFIAGEPPTIKTYKNEFLRQFAAVITSDVNVNHPNPVFQQPGLPWHVGRRQRNHINIEFSKDYDELKAMISIPKTKLLSVVASSKIATEGHRRRVEFVKYLKTYFGDKIDLFGRGFNEIEDKWDALAAYRYHVAIENSSVNHYWTEKISDAFLAGCHPIYYGCPNITDYFPPDSLTIIDINDPGKAIATIEACLEENRYESSERWIREARENVLDTYNLFPLIVKYITEDLQSTAGGSRSPIRLTIKKEPSDSNLLYKFRKKLLRL